MATDEIERDFRLGVAWALAGEPEKAIPLLERSLPGMETVLNQRHPVVLDGLLRLAWAKYDLRDADTAESILAEAEKRMGPMGDRWLAVVRAHQGFLSERLGKRSQASEALREVRRTLDAEVERTSESLRDAYAALGQAQAARLQSDEEAECRMRGRECDLAMYRMHEKGEWRTNSIPAYLMLEHEIRRLIERTSSPWA